MRTGGVVALQQVSQPGVETGLGVTGPSACITANGIGRVPYRSELLDDSTALLGIGDGKTLCPAMKGRFDAVGVELTHAVCLAVRSAVALSWDILWH